MKEGFDHVSQPLLDKVLADAATPKYIRSWIKSFLSDRKCALVFQGSPREMLPISVGTPQGSPVSPLLFVIYVSSLHVSIPKGIVISYVDDLAVTVASPSYCTNIRRLQGVFALLRKAASKKQLTFSLPKSDLIHWCTKRQRGPPSAAAISLDGTLIMPSQVLRWLGYWLTPALNTNHHFSRRLSLANGVFAAIKPMSGPGKGLPRSWPVGWRLASSSQY